MLIVLFPTGQSQAKTVQQFTGKIFTRIMQFNRFVMVVSRKCQFNGSFNGTLAVQCRRVYGDYEQVVTYSDGMGYSMKRGTMFHSLCRKLH